MKKCLSTLVGIPGALIAAALTCLIPARRDTLEDLVEDLSREADVRRKAASQ